MLKLDDQQFLGEATCALSEVSSTCLNAILFLFYSPNIVIANICGLKNSLLWLLFSTMQIVTKSTRTIPLELKRKEGFAAQSQPRHGKLIVHAEECLASKITTEIVFRCSNLESKDLFSKSVSFIFSAPFLLKQITDVTISWLFISLLLIFRIPFWWYQRLWSTELQSQCLKQKSWRTILTLFGNHSL